MKGGTAKEVNISTDWPLIYVAVPNLSTTTKEAVDRCSIAVKIWSEPFTRSISTPLILIVVANSLPLFA